jgi:hypothetical protein
VEQPSSVQVQVAVPLPKTPSALVRAGGRVSEMSTPIACAGALAQPVIVAA